MEVFHTGWYVIYTKPRHEKKITAQLDWIKISNFLPLVKCLRSWSDRRKYVTMPLFPSYVFVKLECIQNYLQSLRINGVLYYVKTGKEIARIRDNLINNLMLINSNSPKNIEISSEYFLPGKNLVIKSGPFTGFDCEVIEFKGKQKLLVRIELLKRNILMEIPACELILT